MIPAIQSFEFPQNLGIRQQELVSYAFQTIIWGDTIDLDSVTRLRYTGPWSNMLPNQIVVIGTTLLARISSQSLIPLC
jgi:hypothetical protein